MNYEQMIDEYSKLIAQLNSNNNLEQRELLEKKISEIRKNLLIYREELLQKEEMAEQLITFSAKFDACDELYGNNVQSKQEDIIDQNEKPKYDLSSQYVISELNGEKISLIGFSISSKIQLIYEHTGQTVSSQDKCIIEKATESYQKFIKNLEITGGYKRYEKKYGSDWKNEVAKFYFAGYDRVVQQHIEYVVENINSKNREKIEILKEELEKSELEKAQLTSEIEQLNTEVKALSEQVAEIQVERKEALTSQKKLIMSMIGSNSKDEDRTYSDGTVKPDMSPSEYGRYTTTRENRDNETGMQTRVNDAAHVHDPLSTKEYIETQLTSPFIYVSDETLKKYQEKYGVYEETQTDPLEEKPKSM